MASVSWQAEALSEADHRCIRALNPLLLDAALGTSLSHAPVRNLVFIKQSKGVINCQIKKRQSSAGRLREGEGDQLVPCPPQLTGGWVGEAGLLRVQQQQQ